LRCGEGDNPFTELRKNLLPVHEGILTELFRVFQSAYF
jgi:hypothetical protein